MWSNTLHYVHLETGPYPRSLGCETCCCPPTHNTVASICLWEVDDCLGFIMGDLWNAARLWTVIAVCGCCISLSDDICVVIAPAFQNPAEFDSIQLSVLFNNQSGCLSWQWPMCVCACTFPFKWVSQSYSENNWHRLDVFRHAGCSCPRSWIYQISIHTATQSADDVSHCESQEEFTIYGLAGVVLAMLLESPSWTTAQPNVMQQK